MKNIGLFGGNWIAELGSTTDVKLFFDCLNKAANDHPESNWSLLTDRLYRKYIRLHELDSALELMNCMQGIFSKLPSSTIDWTKQAIDGVNTKLNLNKSTLADVFDRYFKGFTQCVESARALYEDWGKFLGVRIVVADLPYFHMDKNRPLEDYESLRPSDTPFWLR